MSRLSWFVTGVGIGTLGGILYAPRAGQETRAELLSNAKEKGTALSEQVVAKSGEYMQQGKQAAGQYFSQGKSLASDHLARASAALKAGKEAYAEHPFQEQLSKSSLNIADSASEPGA